MTVWPGCLSTNLTDLPGCSNDSIDSAAMKLLRVPPLHPLLRPPCHHAHPIPSMPILLCPCSHPCQCPWAVPMPICGPALQFGHDSFVSREVSPHLMPEMPARTAWSDKGMGLEAGLCSLSHTPPLQKLTASSTRSSLPECTHRNTEAQPKKGFFQRNGAWRNTPLRTGPAS